MGKTPNFQHWLAKNRLLLWWVIFIPLVAFILIFNRDQFNLPLTELRNFVISPQYKIFNSALIIALARIVLTAVAVVIIMVCLFFPLFRVSKEGVQWTKELEEELEEVSGEIAGEEIGDLIKEESFRWSLIYGWLKLEERGKLDPLLLLRELLATIWEAFPNLKISLCLINEEQRRGILHPLLTKLVPSEIVNNLEEETTFGLKLRFSETVYLLLHIFTDPEGFSQIDEKFILVLSEIFLREVMKQGYSPEELLTYFDQIPLTSQTN